MTIPFEQAVRAFEPRLPLLVAYSGGADSTALLLACFERWPGQVSAAHVHHGLQAAADGFVSHCQEFCSRRGIPLTVERVDARHAAGESPEDMARRARYRSLCALAVGGGAAAQPRDIALAQHADDQAETVLLALTRGAGLGGLSAMPARWQRRSGERMVTLHRPLLRVSAADIRAWLSSRQVAFIEDPSNSNQGLTRNRIRAQLRPILAASFPAYLDTFGRSARHAAQAQELLREVAAQDLSKLGLPLPITALRALTQPRQANLLRHWLQHEHGASASTAQLDELQRQLQACKTAGQQIDIRVGHGQVTRRADWLEWRESSG